MNEKLKYVLARQAFQESGFNPSVTSSKGAQGLTQFMPATWEEYKRTTGNYKADPYNITDAVAAQEWYMNKLYNELNSKNLSEDTKIFWATLRYNWGGAYNFLDKLVKQGKDPNDFDSWKNEIPEETRIYAERILLGRDPKFEENFSKALATSPIAKQYYNTSQQNLNYTFNTTQDFISQATKDKWALLEEKRRRALETVPASSKFEPFTPLNINTLLSKKEDENIKTGINLFANKVNNTQNIKEIPELYVSVFDKMNIPTTTTSTDFVTKFVLPTFKGKFGGKLIKRRWTLNK